MKRETAEQYLFYAMTIGEMLLTSGAEVGRVEDTIRRICMAYGAKRVDVFSITSSINFFKSESKGFLYAEAHEAFSHKRLANCEVRITNEAGELIATFNGTGYRKDTELPFKPLE